MGVVRVSQQNLGIHLSDAQVPVGMHMLELEMRGLHFTHLSSVCVVLLFMVAWLTSRLWPP